MKRSAFFNAASLLLGLGAALFSSAGCATLTNVPTTHIVMVNGRGNPVDHTGPETPLDRTVGRYENLLSAIHNAPDELRGRVHIKAFGAGRDVRTPQKHGDFTSHLKFWKSECWWSPGADYPPDCYGQ